MSLNYVQLLVEQQDAGQDAGAGAVTIAPTSKVTAAGVTVVSQVPVVRQLSAGTVTISLVACDNSGISPAAGFWAYEVQLPNELMPTAYLVNFANGSSQRLDQLTPVFAMTTYGPASGAGVATVFGRSGTVVAASGDYTAAETGALAAQASSTSVPAGALSPQVVALTDAAAILVDADDGNDFRVTIAGNRTMGAPANLVSGQQLTFVVTQGASGGPYTLAWNAAYDFGSAGAPTLSTTAGKADVIAFKAISPSLLYCLGSATGF
jgi:hypothetical protein